MSDSESAVDPKKKSPIMAAAVLVCSVIAIIFGIGKTYRGMKEIFSGGLDPKVKQTLQEVDDELGAAQKITQAVAAPFQGLFTDVDKLGLDVVRKQHREQAQHISDEFGKAATHFTQAHKKSDEAIQLGVADTLKPFLENKGKAYGLFAETCVLNQEIVRLVLDDTVTTVDALLPKLREIAGRRDEKEKAGEAADLEAENYAKKLKSDKK